MSGRPMDLRVSQVTFDEGTRRTVHLTNIGNAGHVDITIYFELVGERDVPPPFVLDGFVYSILFYAMELGQDIRVHGRMSGDALRNVNELQLAWALWGRGRYKSVR